MLIQNNSKCWIETMQIKIKESPQYKFYNNTGDSLIRSFWYHNSDTKRNPWIMLCSHFQLMTHKAIYTTPFTLQLCYKSLDILQRVTKSQKVHISSHDGLENLHNINVFWSRSQGFSKRGNTVAGIFPFPNKVLWEPLIYGSSNSRSIIPWLPSIHLFTTNIFK